MSSESLADREIRRALRRGLLDDAAFDVLFPDHVRAVSGVYWTPLRVATLAAECFDEQGAARVLDVGSGPGKFCLVAAAAEPNLVFTGVEQRPHLVEVARRAARRLRLDNANFLVGDATTVDWSGFDGFYFFNPFAENTFDAPRQFDATVTLTAERRAADVDVVERALIAARVGATVATYHGFGGRIPLSFRLASSRRCGTDWLNVWVKDGLARASGASGASDRFWFEYADEETGAPLFFEEEQVGQGETEADE
jgi:SAM-dependent methyltransferase